MEWALIILNFVSLCGCILAVVSNILCLLGPNDLFTRLVIISSFALIGLVAIPELIINVMLCQEYAFFIAKIIICLTMVILNIIVVCKKMKKGDFKKAKQF